MGLHYLLFVFFSSVHKHLLLEETRDWLSTKKVAEKLLKKIGMTGGEGGEY